MKLISIIIYLAIGALSGWLAGNIMKTGGSLLRNIVLGICGSVVGGWVASIIGISAKAVSLGGILISVGGACLLIFLGRMIFKK